MVLVWLLVGAAGFAVCYFALRWFATVPPGDLAKALRTFIAVFAALAGSGLIFMGRLGIAVVVVAAAVMAFRALRQGRRPPDPIPGEDQGQDSSVVTELLEMRLDHGSGHLEGLVRNGPFRGRHLSALSLAELVAVRGEAERDDPPSVALLEAYLDRRFPDWRAQAFEQGGRSPSSDAMDERTALEILGLAPGADETAIRAAHRRLLSRLHPDHGGSDWLSARINQARDYLIKPRRGASSME
jgi:hypothetical protein